MNVWTATNPLCNMCPCVLCRQEAKLVTADLRALVRRELAELSGSPGGRQQSREETDNTLHFLQALVDNGKGAFR